MRPLATLPITALALAACAASDAPQTQPETETATPAERVQQIRALLQARHPGDLPDRAVLDRHQDAAASLRHLATHDDVRIVRARALLLLRHYPNAETRELLMVAARDKALPSAIRAAALRGMQGFDLGREPELEAELALRIGDSDPMLAVAAVETLATQPATATRVREAAANPQLPRVTREAARRALAR